MTKLSVQLVTWNGSKYISYLFDSLKKQTFSDWELIILDNGSSDDTVEKIKQEIKDFPVEVEFIELKENLGFAGGHNKIVKRQMSINSKVESKYILLLNQDMYLGQNCFEKMVEFLDAHEDVAVVSPRLMKWNFEKRIDGFTNKVDSLGLKVFRNRRVIEKYTNKIWDEKKSKFELSFRTNYEAMEVFGVSATLPMYRRRTIQAIEFSDGNFFDDSYGSYKEDVDLSFRLRSAGFSAFVLLDTVAYHDRSAVGQEHMSDSVAAKNKKTQSEWVKYHSYKNHLMTIYKNEYWQNWLLDAVFIKFYEIKKFVWFLLFDREVLKGLGEVWKMRKELKQKRLEIKQKRTVDWREMRRWWKH